MTREPLSPRQQVMLDTITEYRKQHGYMPTIRDIMAVMGIKSPNGVVVHLRAMERKGWLKREPGASRSIVLADDGELVAVDRAGLEAAIELARTAMADDVVRLLDGLLAAAKGD